MSCNREYLNPLVVNDAFDRSKKFFEIRMMSGDVRQSREDNEEQAILRDLMRRLGDGVWTDGSIVQGCEILAQPVAASATLTVGGTVTVGDVLTATIGGKGYSYTVVTGDTPSKVAESLAASIQGDATRMVDAVVNGLVITLTSRTAGLVGNNTTLVAAVSPGATLTLVASRETLIGGAAVSDNQKHAAVSVGPGWVYVNGIVHEAPDSGTIAVAQTGGFYVGFKITSSVVSAEEDASLRDPATGVANEGLPGADRLKYELVWTSGVLSLDGSLNDLGTPMKLSGSGSVPAPEVYVVGRWVDGYKVWQTTALDTPGVSGPLGAAIGQLAGDYVVSGLDPITVGGEAPVFTAAVGANPAKLDLWINSGSAVINGKTYRMHTKRKLSVNFGDLATYSGSSVGVDLTTSGEFGTLYLENAFSDTALVPTGTVTATRVSLTVRTTQVVTRGGANGAESINEDSLLADMGLAVPYMAASVLRVYRENLDNTVTEYLKFNGTQGDYKVIEGVTSDGKAVRKISWDPAEATSDQPSIGDVYKVELIYDRVLLDTEYDFTTVAASVAGKQAASVKLKTGVTTFTDALVGGGSRVSVPHLGGTWHVTYTGANRTVYVYYRGAAEGRLVWAVKSVDGAGRSVLEWLDTHAPHTVQTPWKWVKGPIPSAVPLAKLEVIGLDVLITPLTQQSLRVSQQELRAGHLTLMDHTKLMLDLMSHAGRMRSKLTYQVAGDVGYDPYAPRPKQRSDYALDGSVVTTLFTYHADGRLKEESVVGRDAAQNSLYTALTTYDYTGEAYELSTATVTYGQVSRI